MAISVDTIQPASRPGCYAPERREFEFAAGSVVRHGSSDKCWFQVGRAFRIASQTQCGVIGIRKSRTP